MNETTAYRQQPVPTFGDIAADLRKVADIFDRVAEVSLARNPFVRLEIQPGGTDDEIIAQTDAVGIALSGEPGMAKDMGSTYHYKADAKVGLVCVGLYDGITVETIQQREAAEQMAAKERELAELRARVAELEAQQVGLTYSREDDDPLVVRPHSPRVPSHIAVREDNAEMVADLADAVCVYETGGGSALRRRCNVPIKWSSAHATWHHEDGVWRGHDAQPPVQPVSEAR